MALSLPAIFTLQILFIVSMLIAILASFTAVTNRTVHSIALQSGFNNLDGLANKINSDVRFMEPLVKVLALKIFYDGDYCNNFSRTLPTFQRHFADHLYLLRNYPGLLYVYQSYQRPNGQWMDCGCGGGYCEYGTKVKSFNLVTADTLPMDPTPTGNNSRDPTNDDYMLQIRSIPHEYNVSGYWHPVTAYTDPESNKTFLLTTFSMPSLFDSSGNLALSISMDLSITWLADSLRERATPGGYIYIVDARRNLLIVHSLSQPQLNPSTSSPWLASATFNKDINDAVYHAGGVTLNNRSDDMVFEQGEWIVSLFHVIAGTMHWVVFDHTSVDYYYGESQRLRSILIAVAVLVVSLCIAIQIGVYLCVVRPLNNMSEAMNRISKLEDGSGDDGPPTLSELGTMHRAYNDLNKAMQSFTRYVPKEVVKDLMMSGQMCEIKMRPVTCSILFVDIKGFTTLCERVSVDALGGLISTYFDHMSALVMHHNGIIDKFIGDCIMAVWGAPFPQDHIQLRAALCALRLHHATTVSPLKDAFADVGEKLSVRVGVACGKVLAGNMGTERRMNYTVIGDSVNLAARLESLNKQFGTHVMVAENVAEACRGKLCMRLLHRVAVVGRSAPVEVWEVLGAPPRDVTGMDASIVSVESATQAPLSPTGSLQQQDSLEFSRNARPDSGPGSGSATPRLNRKTSQGPAQSNWKKEYIKANRVDVDELLSEAEELCSVSHTETLFANQFTKAVRDYLAQDFAQALETLNAMDELTGEKYTDSISVENMYAECERYQKEPPKHFLGYFAASEK